MEDKRKYGYKNITLKELKNSMPQVNLKEIKIEFPKVK